MHIGEYLLMLVKSYNPNQYHKLVENNTKDMFSFIKYTFAISAIVFLCLFIPISLIYIATLNERFEPVTTLKLTGEIEANNAVTIAEHPHIVLDLAANNTPSRTITITRDGIHYPTFYLFGDSTIPWSSIFDLKSNMTSHAFLLTTFLLPSIIFWILVWSMLKIFFLLAILVILAITLPRIFRFRISGSDAVKVAIFSSPSLLLFDFALMPIAPLFWWGALLTTIYFWIAVLLVIEPIPKDHTVHETHVQHTPHTPVKTINKKK